MKEKSWKKKRKVCSGIICLFLFLFYGSTYAAQNDASAGIEKTLSIAMASDLHLDPENRYAGMVNPLVMYNMDIVDALFFDVIQQKADLLLLCGDITNAGRMTQHEALVQKLKTVEDAGIPVFVLPGNHDIGEGEAELFSQMYAEFGFQDACSRDTDSLSYSIVLDDLLILMLDTDGYTNRTDGAFLSDITLTWIHEQLKQAKEKKQQVLVAGHYSLLTGQSTEFTGQGELLYLLEEYEVPLYVCGHLHQRNVSSANSLSELVVEQVSAYPCSYALLYKEGENEYRYTPRRIDVNAWAKETGQTSSELLDFNTYEETVFRERCEETVQLLKGDKWISGKKMKQATDFFRDVQQEYLEGSLYDHKEDFLKHPGYKIFMTLAEGTTYGRWMPVFLENAGPYTAGFVLKDHQLSR